MTASLYVVEMANLFCGDDDPQNSKHLTIEELTLPDLSAVLQDHHPGGSMFAIEVNVGVAKLVSTFKLKGIDPQLMAKFGLGTQEKNRYTAYGAVRDKRTGKLIELKAVMEGSLGKVTADAFKRGDSLGHMYSINEITHYDVNFGGEELIYWDFWTNQFRTGGVDRNAAANRILRIPNVAG